jgi:sugar lactone lactonase YvrE
MKRPTLLSTAFVAVLLVPVATATPTLAAQAAGRPDSYALTGDPAGSRFEGIGVDEPRGVFYVSEVTGGEIHRGTAPSAQVREWLPGDGTHGRFTARGITVDDIGRVYVAGGPNGIGTGRPDLWVYDADGTLLAALRAPGDDVFLNDVAIGPDGAAYFTNSNDAQIFRVSDDGAGWRTSLWSDATDTVERRAGFNLGGIVVTADHSAFVVAQGNTGRLWRFATAGGGVSEVDIAGADLVDADGLVRRGDRLTVVRNFSRMLAHLRLDAGGSRALLLGQEATAPDRVLTTAKALRGRVLFVDSKFDEALASGPYQVVTGPTR